MSFFKRRTVALLLTLIVVVASTLLSTNIKLGRKAQDVTDGFFNGVVYNGFQQKGIAAHLKNILAYADGMVTIARNYSLDTADAENASDSLKRALSYADGNISYIHYAYEELLSAVTILEDQLNRAELSERDAEGLRQYSDSLTGARSAIDNAGYNESVREFLREYSQFPTKLLADLAGVKMPQYFA